MEAILQMEMMILWISSLEAETTILTMVAFLTHSVSGKLIA